MVESVEPVAAGGATAHRVTIQFPVSGRKKLVAPPAVLCAPQAEQPRTVGWLEALGGRNENDLLTSLPAEATDVLGSPAARFRAAVRLYRYDGDNPHSLQRWATDQTRLADPLSHWSRDELAIAFNKFALERDAHLRAVAAKLKMGEGDPALRAAIVEAEEPLRSRVQAALGRPI